MAIKHAAVTQRNGRVAHGSGLLTVSQVAEILNVHPNSVRRWADMNLFPSYRIGFRRDRRFKAEDVSRFLDSRIHQ